jgi:hypothetical protein
MPEIQRQCPECRAAMHEVRIIDKGDEHSFQPHGELEYTAADAKRGFWSAKFPVVGKVVAYMCQQCGRIALYGAEYKP